MKTKRLKVFQKQELTMKLYELAHLLDFITILKLYQKVYQVV